MKKDDVNIETRLDIINIVEKYNLIRNSDYVYLYSMMDISFEVYNNNGKYECYEFDENGITKFRQGHSLKKLMRKIAYRASLLYRHGSYYEYSYVCIPWKKNLKKEIIK